MPESGNVESTLIWYKGTDKENYKHWVKSLEEFLEGILKHTIISTCVKCLCLIRIMDLNVALKNCSDSITTCAHISSVITFNHVILFFFLIFFF